MPSDATVLEAVRILSRNRILGAPVRDVGVDESKPWSERYLGMVDFSAVVLWVLDQVDLAAAALSAGTGTLAGMGAGVVGALGTLLLGMTGPGAVVGVTAAAVGAAIAGGMAAGQGTGGDQQPADGSPGDDFYRVLLQEEPFKSTKVADITRSYRWSPFLPLQSDDNMLTVLLCLSKLRMRSVPVLSLDRTRVVNLIAQSAVVRGLADCRGADWFDLIARQPLRDLGLPLMPPAEVVAVGEEERILDAFALMREKNVGGLPVVRRPGGALVANVSVRDVQFLLLHPDLFDQRRSLTVKDFVQTVASNCKHLDESASRVAAPITCTEDDTLVSVITKLCDNHIHRVHVVDERQQLRGVVTLRDIISSFVSAPPGYFKHYLEDISDGDMEVITDKCE